MKPERGYFQIDLKGEAHWIASQEGIWLLDPEVGLRRSAEKELIAGVDPGDTGVFIEKIVQTNEK